MSSDNPGLESADGPQIRFSVVLPVAGSSGGLAAAIGDYGRGLADLGERFEMILVPGPDQTDVCAELAKRHEWLSTCDPLGVGWGRAVRAGVAAATGEILCYTNWERTSGRALTEMLRYARGSSELVLRANRRTRDTRRQRAGSLLFNLECRALLGTTAWDVNGTPKVFWRTHAGLLALERDDDLIDVEFALVCEREGYPVAEIPIEAGPVTGHVQELDYASAMRMYVGVLSLRRRFRS
jgi:hypothetical protein